MQRYPIVSHNQVEGKGITKRMDVLTTLEYKKLRAYLYSDKVLEAFFVVEIFRKAISLLASTPLNILTRPVVMFFINIAFLRTHPRCQHSCTGLHS